MFKRYVVFTGATYYPGAGMDDCIGTCDTREEANTLVKAQYPNITCEDGVYGTWAALLDTSVKVNYFWDSWWDMVTDQAPDEVRVFDYEKGFKND